MNNTAQSVRHDETPRQTTPFPPTHAANESAIGIAQIHKEKTMSNPATLRDTVDKSYARCRMTGTFADDFYLRFLGSSAKIAEKFAMTNMEQQKRMLDHGIRHLILFFHDPSAITTAKMMSLGESHAQSGMNIEPSYYAFFLDALIKTVEENDSQFNSELENAWRQVVGYGIDVMISMWDD